MLALGLSFETWGFGCIWSRSDTQRPPKIPVTKQHTSNYICWDLKYVLTSSGWDLGVSAIAQFRGCCRGLGPFFLIARAPKP